MTRNASIFAKVGILRVKEFHAPPIAEDFGAVERRRFQGVCDACRMEPLWSDDGRKSHWVCAACERQLFP